MPKPRKAPKPKSLVHRIVSRVVDRFSHGPETRKQMRQNLATQRQQLATAKGRSLTVIRPPTVTGPQTPKPLTMTRPLTRRRGGRTPKKQKPAIGKAA